MILKIKEIMNNDRKIIDERLRKLLIDVTQVIAYVTLEGNNISWMLQFKAPNYTSNTHLYHLSHNG